MYVVCLTTQWVHGNTGQHGYQTKKEGGTGGGGRGADEEEGIERNKDEGCGRKNGGREGREEGRKEITLCLCPPVFIGLDPSV